MLFSLALVSQRRYMLSLYLLSRERRRWRRYRRYNLYSRLRRVSDEICGKILATSTSRYRGWCSSICCWSRRCNFLISVYFFFVSEWLSRWFLRVRVPSVWIGFDMLGLGVVCWGGGRVVNFFVPFWVERLWLSKLVTIWFSPNFAFS